MKHGYPMWSAGRGAMGRAKKETVVRKENERKPSRKENQ